MRFVSLLGYDLVRLLLMVSYMKLVKVASLLVFLVVFIGSGCSKRHFDYSTFQEKGSIANEQKTKVDPWLPFPAMPTDERISSLPVENRYLSVATDPILGKGFVDQNGALNRSDETNPNSFILISDKSNPIAYAQYSISDVNTDRPVTIKVTAEAAKLKAGDTNALPLEYYIAIANYTKWCWEWFGPYKANATLTINSKTRRDRYLTPKDKFNYLIAASIRSNDSSAVGLSITKSQISISAASYPTLPYYQKIEFIRVGQNLLKKTVSSKTVSELTDDQCLNLEWTHLLTSRPADDITMYNVYFRVSGEKNFTNIGTIKAPTTDQVIRFVVPKDCDPSVLSVITPKLELSKPLEFTINSINSIGAAVQGKPMFGTIPSILPPQNLVASNDKDTGVELNWTKATDATGYKIYRDNQDSSLIEVGDINTYEDPAADTLEHTYWITSINSIKEESGFCMNAVGKKVPPLVPLNPVKDLTASTDLPVGIQLNWTMAPNATGYEIYRDLQTNLIQTVGNVNQYLDDTITDFKDYKYWIKAIAPGWKNSDFSNAATGKMIIGGGVIDPPDPVSASNDRSDGIYINWSKVKTATYYNIYRDTQDKLIASVGDIDNYLDTSITDYISHSYWIKAYNLSDKSDFSKVAMGKRVDLSVGDIYEPDNSLGEAKLIVPTDKDQVQYRSIKPLLDQDWVMFDATKDVKYTFYSLGNTDVQLFLYDKDGVQLDSDDDDGPSTNFLLVWTCVTTDRYYMKIIRYNNTTTGDYDFHFIYGDNVLFPPEGFSASTTRTDGINLTWTKSTNATGYKIYRDKNDTLLTTVGDVTTYLDNTIKDSNNHSYWIKATNATTDSGLSTESKGKMLIIDSYEPDNSSAEAKPITISDTETTQKRNILPAADEDWVKFTPTKDVNYNFYTTGTLDTIGEIYDSTITLVTSDDQSGVGSNFYINWVAPDSGIYYLKIKHYSASSTGDYEFVFNSGYGFVQPPEGLSGSTDNSSGILLKWTKSKSATGYRIFDDNKFMIGEVGDVDNWLDDKVADYKTHSFWIKAFNPKFESDYSAVVTGRKFREITTDKYESDSTSGESRTLNFTNTVQTEEHSIYPEGDEDWFSFTGVKNEIYSLYSTSESNLDTYIHIYDSTLTQLTYDDDSGPGLCFRVDFVCPANGLYYIKIRGYGTTTTYNGWYSLNYYSGGGTLLIPTSLTASTTNSSYIKLDWVKSKDAIGYFIYRDDFTLAPLTKVGDVATYSDYVTDTLEHTYWVRAMNETNGSPFSASAKGQKAP